MSSNNKSHEVIKEIVKIIRINDEKKDKIKT